MKERKFVLVCEDDPAQLRLLTRAFGKRGYNVLGADSPRTALQKTRGRTVDAIVTDVQLNQGNAFDLVKNLRQDGQHSPVIMMSGNATPAMRDRARAEGAREFLEKPFELTKVLKSVNEAIDQNPSLRIGARILVVEDHPQTAKVLAAMLDAGGFHTRMAKDGAEALKLLRSAGPSIDMVLVDMHTPPPSGAELIREICSVVPGMFVAMITGEATTEEVRAGYKAGARNLFHKPVSPKRLASVLQNHLPEAREARQREMREASVPWQIRGYRHVRSFFRKGGRLQTALVIAAAVMVSMVAVPSFQNATTMILDSEDHFKHMEERAEALYRASQSAGAFRRAYLDKTFRRQAVQDRYMRGYYDRQLEIQEAQETFPGKGQMEGTNTWSGAHSPTLTAGSAFP